MADTTLYMIVAALAVMAPIAIFVALPSREPNEKAHDIALIKSDTTPR